MPRPQPPYVKINTKKPEVEISRGWPIPENDDRLEVVRLVTLGIGMFLGTLTKLFPRQRKTIAACLRTAADTIEREMT